VNEGFLRVNFLEAFYFRLEVLFSDMLEDSQMPSWPGAGAAPNPIMSLSSLILATL
jgi:hypothetical protein